VPATSVASPPCAPLIQMFRAIVDAQEIQPLRSFVIPTGGVNSVRVPPRTLKRTAIRHFLIGKEIFVGIIHSRKGLEICAVVWVGVRFIRHQGAHHGRRNVPSCANSAHQSRVRKSAHQ